MNLPHLSRIRVARLAGIVISLCLAAQVAHAAMYVDFNDGPRYNSGNNSLTLGACSDTGNGELVKIQYTLNGADLTNPPDTGNGIKATCTLTTEAVCSPDRYWICSVPNVGGVTYKYRFYVTNASNQFYGLVTDQLTFATSFLAVTVDDLQAKTAPANQALNVAAVSLALTAIALAALAVRTTLLARRR